MAHYSGVFILDSKYYKYGLTGFYSHLPGAESVCKQMAYAEYVEQLMQEKEIPAGACPEPVEWAGMTSGNIYNAFIMPYCADAEGASASSASFQMKREGYIYGDWKDRGQDYHKIHCILLDMKSVMRNYASNPTAQSELVKLISH
jgi:hypothetical protein